MRLREPVRTRLAFALVFAALLAMGSANDGVHAALERSEARARSRTQPQCVFARIYNRLAECR
jgi:hypothetical protein